MYVVTGAPGSGKSTVVPELVRLNSVTGDGTPEQSAQQILAWIKE